MASQRHYYFEPVKSENTLTSASVTALFQDHRGYVWIATQGSLHRYDGYSYTTLLHEPDDAKSLPGSFVTALTEDDRHRIWVGTMTHGLAVVDPNDVTVSGFSRIGKTSIQPRDMIGALNFEAGRGLWIGTAAGIELMNVDNGKRRQVFHFKNSSVQQVFGFARSADKTLWSATAGGLLRIPLHDETPAYVDLTALPAALSVMVDATGHVYAGGNDGLYLIDGGAKKATRIWPANGQQSRMTQVRAIVQDPRGRLWLAVPGQGLVVYDPASGDAQDLQHDPLVPGSLPDNFTVSLMLDRSGLLWLGGTISGAATVDPAGAEFDYVVDPAITRGQMSNSIRAILADGHGGLWLGTASDGLKHYDPATDRFTYYNKAFPPIEPSAELMSRRLIAGLAKSDDGQLWVATNHGAFRFDPQTRQTFAVPIDPQGGQGLPNQAVRCLLVADDGSIWFGTYGYGLVHWWPPSSARESHWEIFRHDANKPDSLADNTVLALFQDKAKRIWIGTFNGLSVYDSDGMHTHRHEPSNPQSLGDNLIRTIYQSGDGALWIGTQSGLDRLDVPSSRDIQFAHYTTRDGLPGTSVFGILEDAEHNIWLSTNHGICVFHRASASFRSFEMSDGLQGMEFNAAAAANLPGGKLAFGGLFGLNLFNPQRIAHNSYRPPIVITSISIGNGDFISVPASGVVMKQSQRLLRIHFAALDYHAPERNRFAYRMRGFDPEWINAGSRHMATYTNLPAGDYVFEVRGSNADHVWNDRDTHVHIRVTPPPWLSKPAWLAYLALAAMMLAAILVAYRRKRRSQRQYHAALQERDDRLRMALWGSGDEFWDWDLRTGLIHRIGVDQLVDGSREESQPATEWRRRVLHPDDDDAFDRRLADHLEGRTRFFESEHRVRDAMGEWIWVLSRGKIVAHDGDGKVLRMCGTARNITAARSAEIDRRIASQVIDCMGEAVAVTDLDFRFVAINRAFTKMFGYDQDEVVGKGASLLDSRRHEPEHYLAMRHAFLASGYWHGELWQRRKDGTEFLSQIEISEVRDEAGERTHYVGVISDITERKRTEQELRYLANYDTLTGLPNRTLLGERLAHAVIRARRTGRKVALLFLDLDRFKHVNDSMGHVMGDRVLKTVAERLRSNVDAAATVARLGGDEFTIVLEDVRHNDEPIALANELLEVFSKPLRLESGQQVMISPSIGISLYPDHAQVPTDLLKCADTAMYQAKDAGRNMYQLYAARMDRHARHRAGMLSALRLAIEHDEFHLVYQPMLNLRTGRISGAEALLRWHNAEFGEVPPAVFVPLAEEAGLIERIGEFVLYRACAQLRDWLRSGIGEFLMSVNLSALQLLRNELTERLCEILAELQLAPEHLELELTESILMANPELAIHTLDRMHALGVAIAIDDFGTGYSSLSYLKRLPIDTLKIDRSFVGDITADPDDKAITRTIINMAHSLSLNVVGEGVETAEQLDYLREHGCDVIQGHWLSPPLDPVACYEFIQEFAKADLPAAPHNKMR